ncbi:hypothetical protein [Mangrovimonas sp. DI 80]|uniref:hypothetical protein n=1 Tax=Mangrovimonas sp. DI 80 TaxID=1779330 RepID=UPI0009761625|nr:hypothetical protein [Mangrovimonas sp. DI 80]OMP29871.1 hypothetical protein BKM32_14770 [Mangrovimonas sp. DI 80]
MSCKKANIGINSFSESNDTISLRLTKQKGSGLFQLGAGSLQFKDTSEVFSYSVKYPKSVDSITRSQLKVDLKEARDFQVEIIKGYKNGIEVFVVDENNNKDFTDDPIREYKPMDWTDSANLVKCEYLISNGRKTIKDSSWLNIGNSHGRFLIGKREFLMSEFNIGNEMYKIGIVESANPLSFTYGYRPEVALLSHLGKEKDTVYNNDLLALGEFLNFNGKYYRFESISNNGDLAILVRERNFGTKIGTQKGMIAPNFKVLTMSGDTLTNTDLKNKFTVIANSCGCGGDKKSTQAFYEMEEQYRNTLNVLHVDSNIKNTDIGIHINSEEGFNKNFYEAYRKTYCSRLCYVIGNNNRIVDKFNINEWKTKLPQLVENNK